MGVVCYDKSRPEPLRAQMEWIDYGFAILSPAVVIERVAPGEAADLSDLMRDLSREGRLAGHEIAERFYEIGSPEGLADLQSHLMGLSDMSLRALP
jgi:hypothetical protein